MKFSSVSLLIMILAISLSSCRTLKIESPPAAYNEAKITPPSSDITLPFNISIGKLESLINKEFTGVIYDDNSYENNGHDDMMIRATKAGDFRIYMDQNEISYRIPLDIRIKKRTTIGAMGYSYTDEREINGSIALKFRTKVTVTKDWKLVTTTTSDGYEWLRQPSVKVGPISFPLGFIADMLISANQKTINNEIDKALSSALDIRKMMSDLWKSIQVPFKIEAEYPLWARFTPLQVRMVPPKASNGYLQIIFGIKTRSEIFYNETPPQNLPATPLPEILMTSRLDNDISIGILADVPFSHINELAEQQLKGYTLKQGKYTVTIEHVSLYGNGDDLVVAADISGSVKGTVYLKGKPWFDRTTSSFKVADLDFDVKTKNVLVKSAGWLFHNGLLESVQSKLEYPVGEQLQGIRKQLHDMLATNPELDMFRISGAVDKVDISSIYITSSGMKGMFEFKGRVAVDF